MPHPEIEILLSYVAWPRRPHGLTKKELARIMGISVQSLNRIEQGDLPPGLTIAFILNMWDFFHITPKELLTRRLLD